MELYYNTLLNKTKEIGLIHLDLLGFLCDTFSWIYTRISDKLIVHFVRGFELFTHIHVWHYAFGILNIMADIGVLILKLS